MFTPANTMRSHMHLQGPVVIGSHFPTLYANRQYLQRPNAFLYLTGRSAVVANMQGQTEALFTQRKIYINV